MSVVTLAQVKTHLNITVTTYDTELQTFIDSAEAAIAEKTGPLTSVATTERVRGGGSPGLVVRETPIVSLTSVTPVGGAALTVADLTVTKSAGVIEWTSGATFRSEWYDVVYQAGRSTVPEDLKTGVKELVRHTWAASQRGAPRGAAAAAQAGPQSAHLFVYMVQEHIQPHVQVGN